jgi:hypothetical protein
MRASDRERLTPPALEQCRQKTVHLTIANPDAPLSDEVIEALADLLLSLPEDEACHADNDLA